MKTPIVGLLFLYAVMYAADAIDLCADISGGPSHYSHIDTVYSRLWTPISPPGAVDDRLMHGVVYDDNNDMVYMIGGSQNGGFATMLPLIYAYNAGANTWDTTLTPMPEARGYIHCAEWNDRVYVMGGYTNAGQASNTCYVYDIVNDSWSQGTDLPRLTLAHGTIAHNGNIYVIGGLKPNLIEGWYRVDRYHIATDSWTEVSPLEKQYAFGGMTIIDNTIYIIGGYDHGVAQCWTHVGVGVINPSDPNEIAWSYEAALPRPNVLNGVASLANLRVCYMLGGLLNASNVTNEYWQYKPSSNEFTRMSNYPVRIARGNFFVGRKGFYGVFAMAGDANADWDPPNNYYHEDWDAGIEEEGTFIRENDFGPTIFSGSLLLPENKTCKVFDITGRAVAPDKIKPGIYFVEVDGKITRKVVKVR